MEEYGVRSNEDVDSDEDLESGKKKKKRAEALGALLVEPKEAKEAKQVEAKREKSDDTKEADEKSDEEVPLEELSDTEVAEVRRAAAEAELAVLGSERVDGLSAEDVLGDQLVEDFLEQVAREAQEPDAAMESTLSKIGVTAEEAAALESEPAEPATAGESEPGEPGESEPDESEPETPEDAAAPPPPPPRPPRPTAEAGGDDVPPPPRPRRVMPRIPTMGYSADLHGALPGRLRTEYMSSFNEQGAMDAALIGGAGGMVGYLIGRRRGRLKTEKQLLPVQKKLEKQVKDLQSELHVSESKLRKVASERVRAHGPTVIERSKPAAAEKPAQPARAAAPEQPVRTAEAATRHAAPEAGQLHGNRQAQERLGRMVVVAESARAAGRVPERPARAEAPRPPLKVEKNVDTMARSELLELSDKIIIDGASLRQVYETRLVGERGLRRLVSEHLRGGNVKKMLRKEIVEREIDFERDPAMRDLPAQTGGAGGGQASLKAMLDRVEPQIGADDEEKAYYKARTAYDAQQQTEQKQKRRLADVSMGAVIAVLLALVLILLLSHR